MKGSPRGRSGSAIGRRTATYQVCALGDVAIFDLDPAVIDYSQATPGGEALLGRQGNQLSCPLTQGCVVSKQQTEPGAECQSDSQRRLMTDSSSLGDRRSTL